MQGLLDELGYLPFAQTGGQLLFHLISRLYERTSVIVTTNLTFGVTCGEGRLAVAGCAVRTVPMDRRKDSAQVQRLEVVELGRRRRWSAEAKLRIVEESFAGWRQASATARRHGISPSLLFAWRKVYRAGALVDAEPGGFVPAVVVDERPGPAPAPSRIEIVTPNGYRVLAGADVDEAALVRVLAVLARA